MERRIREISKRLIKRSQSIWEGPREPVNFSGDPDTDALISNIEAYPHLFVLGCVVDRQIKSERAWKIPYRIGELAGGWHFQAFENLSLKDLKQLFKRNQLHRYPERMAENFHAAIATIRNDYKGDASLIWSGKPSSAEVVYRFLQFKGIGPKLASMAVNILAREFKVTMSDYYSVDISVDVHVKRVLTRAGVVRNGASNEEIIFAARALNPDYPGMLDFATFEIGRNFCRPKAPLCGKCLIRNGCLLRADQFPSAHDQGASA